LCTPPAAAADSNAAKATVLAEQAMKFHFGGKPALAIALYKQAYKLDPQPGYLYSAARAAHKAGLLDEAHRDYTAVLALVDQKSPFYAKAKQRLDEVIKARAAAAKTKKPEATKPADAPGDKKAGDTASKPDPAAPSAAVPVKKPENEPPAGPVVVKKPENKGPDGAVVAKPSPVTPAPPSWHGTAGFAAVGVGFVAAGGALLLAMGAVNQAERLDGYKDPDTGKYDSSKIGREELRTEETSHNLKVIGAYGLGIVGVAAIGLGAKLLLAGSERVAIRPAGRGLQLAVSF